MASAHAAPPVDIYQAEALVRSQAEAERNAAARATFGEVIIRVSGQRRALEHPAVRQAINNAPNYLFGFTYQSTRKKITVKGRAYPAVRLQLNYSPEAINQLLRQSQLPVWPAQRPKVLVWLVAQESSGLHIVPQASALHALQAQAAYRGLPTMFPAMDIEDNLSISPDDLWRMDLEKIQAASQRYKPDAILIGRYTPYSMGPIPPRLDPDAPSVDEASESGIPSTTMASDTSSVGPWVGEWHLVQGDNTQVFTDETPEVAGLFESAIDRAADYLAGLYAITPSLQGASPRVAVLHIGGIDDFGAFKQAQRYLSELAMVEHMDVLQVNKDGLLVALTTEGDSKVLVSTLALGGKLQPAVAASASIAAPDAQVPLHDTALGDIDPVALADLEAAIAAEQRAHSAMDTSAEMPVSAGLPTSTDAPIPVVAPVQAGTSEDPFMYVWQAR